MYQLRDFEPDDLSAIARDLPAYAATAREIQSHPGGLSGVIVHDARERIAGCLVAVCHQLVTNTRTIGLGIVRIAHIAEEARIGGIHSLLLELDSAFSERFEGSDKRFQAMIAQWHEEDIWCLRRLRDYEPVAQSLTFAGVVTPQRAPEGVTIAKLSAAELSGEQRMCFDEGPTAGVQRTAAMLHHGVSQPGRQGWLARRGEQVVGWAVARVDRGTDSGANGQADGDEAVLEDHWIDWHEPPLAAAMLAAVAADHKTLRVTRWSHHEAEIAALQTAGLRIRGPENLIAARVSAFGIAPASLAEFASLGEMDVGATGMPQLSRNERIVTPPPPGTQSTRGDHRRSSANRKIQSR